MASCRLMTAMVGWPLPFRSRFHQRYRYSLFTFPKSLVYIACILRPSCHLESLDRSKGYGLHCMAQAVLNLCRVASTSLVALSRLDGISKFLTSNAVAWSGWALAADVSD